MSEKKDWRLQGQESYLQGVTLYHRQYHRYVQNSKWDHDHCEFCNTKFMVEEYSDVLHQGYSTADDYHWVCEKCFGDFKDIFQWIVIENLDINPK
jgi:hypothetical protein